MRNLNNISFMHRALHLAQKGLGKVSPNPLVGCVIVKKNQIIAEGYHKKFGDPHAEINALEKAGKNSKNAEMYITLEPCCHYGKTPPCTDAIIKAGIKKVYIAMQDPNYLVSGKGIQILKQHNIQVEIGTLEKEAKQLNEKFIHFIQNKTPFVSLKIASTLDGKITRQDGIQQITNLKSQKFVHRLRNEYDAILVGKNTVLKDNPQLTPYLFKNKKSPLRIILDTNLELNPSHKVFTDSNFIIVCKKGLPQKKQSLFIDKGGEVLQIGTSNHELKNLLKKLGEMNISSLLVEGGSHVFTSFLNQNLVQKVYWFQAPLLNGKDGIDGLRKLKKIYTLKEIKTNKIDNNLLITGYLK